MNDNKFTTGLMLGIIIGGGAVFLLGTRTGKNLLKILSEQGMDGLTDLLEEYNIGDLVNLGDEPKEEVEDSVEEDEEVAQPKENHVKESEPKAESKPAPKKHFFKRIRK